MSDAAFLQADAVTKSFKVQRKGEGLLDSLRTAVTGQLMHVQVAQATQPVPQQELPALQIRHADPRTGQDELGGQEVAVEAPVLRRSSTLNGEAGMTALATIAYHSGYVGSRQSPLEDPSVKPQSPCFSRAAVRFARTQFPVSKQSACFSQIRPVTVSVTVPFPQST